MLANAFASIVLPVPGRSSSSRWPPETRQVNASRTTCLLPRTACSTLATSRPNVSANHLTSSVWTVAMSDIRSSTPRESASWVRRSGDA